MPIDVDRLAKFNASSSDLLISTPHVSRICMFLLDPRVENVLRRTGRKEIFLAVATLGEKRGRLGVNERNDDSVLISRKGSFGWVGCRIGSVGSMLTYWDPGNLLSLRDMIVHST